MNTIIESSVEPVTKNTNSNTKDFKNYEKNANKLANKVFKKNANKTDSNIQSIIFLCFGLVVILIIFLLIKLLNYSDPHINTLISLYANSGPNRIISIADKFTTSALMFGIILVTIFLAIFLFQISVGETPQFVELVWSLIRIGIPIIGFTMIVIYNLPLMIRAFENTFGYAWISGNSLKDLTGKIFENSTNSYNNYSIIATQLSEENFQTYLSSMKKDVKGISRFKDVFLKNEYFTGNKLNLMDKINDAPNPIYELLEKVVQKRYISEATWLSLAAILTMYSTYLVI